MWLLFYISGLIKCFGNVMLVSLVYLLDHTRIQKYPHNLEQRKLNVGSLKNSRFNFNIIKENFRRDQLCHLVKRGIPCKRTIQRFNCSSSKTLTAIIDKTSSQPNVARSIQEGGSRVHGFPFQSTAQPKAIHRGF